MTISYNVLKISLDSWKTNRLINSALTLVEQHYTLLLSSWLLKPSDGEMILQLPQRWNKISTDDIPDIVICSQSFQTKTLKKIKTPFEGYPFEELQYVLEAAWERTDQGRLLLPLVVMILDVNSKHSWKIFSYLNEIGQTRLKANLAYVYGSINEKQLADKICEFIAKYTLAHQYYDKKWVLENFDTIRKDGYAGHTIAVQDQKIIFSSTSVTVVKEYCEEAVKSKQLQQEPYIVTIGN